MHPDGFAPQLFSRIFGAALALPSIASPACRDYVPLANTPF